MSRYLRSILLGASLVFVGVGSAGTVQVPVLIDEDLTALVPVPGFTLWQLRSAVHEGQMMSYVIRTGRERKIIVIDGGLDLDADTLKGFLADADRGNHVHMWFVSHQHPDHIGALTKILEDHNGPQVDHIYGSLLATSDIPDVSEDFQYEQGITAFDFARNGKPFTELLAGQVLAIDGVKIEILGAKNPGLTTGNDIINNSSVVMKVSDGVRSVLFTGDLGTEGADALLGRQYAPRLKSDYVQMAHHGNGANTDFYNAVGAKYCLWPTTENLWDLYTSNPIPVEAEDRCGLAETSGRHYRAFDADQPASAPLPYYQEIP